MAGALFALVDARNRQNVLSSPRATMVKKEDESVVPVPVEPLATISTVEKDIDLSDVATETEPVLAPEDPKTYVDIEAAKKAAQIASEEARKAAEEAERAAKEAAEAEMIAKRWETVEDINYFARQVWTGMFQGFYGMSMKAVKPTDDCFGTWVTESMHELVNFGWDMSHDFSHVSFMETETAAYDVVDLVFRNDEYCHFRQTFWDVWDFCHIEGNCTDILTNV